MRQLNDVDMSAYTSFKVGGKATAMAIVDTADELADIIGEWTEGSPSDSGYLLLGNGSNTIFACEEYRGLVLKLGEAFDFIDIYHDGTIKAGAATLLSRLAKAAGGEGFTGL